MNKWLKESEYTQEHPVCLQYFDSRFKGSDNPESILDFYLPVVKKQ